MEKAFYEGKRLLNVSELCNYIGMGKSRGVGWAKGIGAAKRIGRRVLFDRYIVDKAIEECNIYTRDGKKKGDLDHDC